MARGWSGERSIEWRLAQSERARKYPKETDSRSRLYHIWRAIKSRCSCKAHEAYPRYGGRGIAVCVAWQQYETFRQWALSSGYRVDLEIDRENNDGNYEPGNCRWVTKAEQQRNRRNNLAPITAFDTQKTPIEWSEDPRCVVSYGLLWKRLLRGEKPEQAMIRPSNRAVKEKVRSTSIGPSQSSQ